MAECFRERECNTVFPNTIALATSWGGCSQLFPEFISSAPTGGLPYESDGHPPSKRSPKWTWLVIYLTPIVDYMSLWTKMFIAFEWIPQARPNATASTSKRDGKLSRYFQIEFPKPGLFGSACKLVNWFAFSHLLFFLEFFFSALICRPQYKLLGY